MNPSACDCSVSVIIPTRNRCAVLAATLDRLAGLPDRNFEIIVVDNGSTDDTRALPARRPEVRWIALGENLGCAARNVGAVAAEGRILLMLDDDSWPTPGVIDRIVERFDERPDLGAIACRVRLAAAPHRHDAGGVPGVFFNCGGAVRREAFLDVGGYPTDFGYYAEEYDLCCRLWRGGLRVEPHGDLLVHHARVAANRDADRMVRLLVRNNVRLWRRYSPSRRRDALIDEVFDRYRRVAEKEGALQGLRAGLRDLENEGDNGATGSSPLSEAEFADLFGLRKAREVISAWADNRRIKNVAVWGRGKGCELLIEVIRACNIRVDAVWDHPIDGPHWRGIPLRDSSRYDRTGVDGIVAGSLSPGVAEDTVHDLRRRLPSVPALSAAPWIESGGEIAESSSHARPAAVS